MVNFLTASWPAPPNVKAITTTRKNGYSKMPFASNNLGLHVNDDPAMVIANRLTLKTSLALPNEPHWLEQTHSTECIVAETDTNRRADASVTRSAKHVLAIMTADCQPILLCNKQGTEIAAIHAGWRGLVSGVIEKTLAKMHSAPADVLVWIGPAICQNCYEVGDDVFDIYVNKYPFTRQSFKPHGQKWLVNLAQITADIFNELAILDVYRSNNCTFELKDEFYSYRREQQTGRMASLIWFNEI